MRNSKFIIRRILQTIPILVIVTVLAFMLSNISGGDVAAITIRSQGQEVSKENLAAMHAALGLDMPLYEQYGVWLQKAVQLDFGTSFQTGKPVTDEIFSRFPATVRLALAATFFAVAIAVPLAILSVRYKDSWCDHLLRVFSTAGVAMPDFWLGLMLLYFFAVKLHIVPVISGNKWDNIFLPAVTLSVSYGATYLRVLRENLLEISRLPYICAGRARGLGRTEVLFRHGLKNAMLPCITLIGINFGKLLAGQFAVETIFSWNGIGKFAVESIRLKDMPVIQGYIMCVAIAYIIINLLLDILYLYINPKIRIEE